MKALALLLLSTAAVAQSQGGGAEGVARSPSTQSAPDTEKSQPDGGTAQSDRGSVGGGKLGAQTNVVLVHGAFADGSSWRRIIPLLEAKNLHVVAAQIPETSFADDVAATKRLVAAQQGPVVLVGHSYGGQVITAAANDPNVKALVYVAALVPEQGESVGDLLGRGPEAPGGKHIIPESPDYLWLDPSAFHDMFCQDVPAAEAKIMVAVQKPIAKAAFGAKLDSAARWHDLPSWYILTEGDHMIAPELQKFMATRAKAKIVTAKGSSHVPMISQPQKVANAIVEAALYKQKPQP